MAPLFLLFDIEENELRALFTAIGFAERGVLFGDGSAPVGANGTLFYRGAAFDYTIESASKPIANHHIFCDSDLAAIRSAISLNLGAAIASGQHVPAVINALMLLGETLGSTLNAKATFWQPAMVISGFGYFAEAVRQYDEGAAFPSLVCIGFDTSSGEHIRTSGLAWLSGQELAFEQGSLPVNEAMRYVVRLVHDIATNGAVERVMEVPGMNDSERLILSPDGQENILTARRIYVQNAVNLSG